MQRLYIKNWFKFSIVTFRETYILLFLPIVVMLFMVFIKWYVFINYGKSYLVTVCLSIIGTYLYGCMFSTVLRYINNVTDRRFVFINHKIFFLYFVVDIITSFIFLVGLIFFVIPGIILILKYCMSGLVVLDKGAKPLEALKESNILTKDNRSSLLFLVLLAIIMNLGGILNTYFMKSILGNGNEIGSMLVMLIITAINVFFLVPMFSVAAVCAYSILKDTRTIQKPVGL